MSQPRFLLVGFGAELALAPLARVLSARGLAVATADLARGPVDTACAPGGDGPLVLVSSQHFAISGTAYDEHIGVHSHYAPPQALRERVQADLMVFVPHDLLDVLLAAELPALAVFDLLAMPDEDHWWAAAHVPTVDVGWIGHAADPGAPPPGTPVAEGVLFVTAESWVRANGGGEFLLRSLQHTLATGIAVRFSRWPGAESLAAPLARAGVPLVDADIPASALIAHTPLVVSNAPSSVLAEASLVGHRPICVMEGGPGGLFAGTLDAIDVVVCHDHEFGDRVGRAGRLCTRTPSFDVDAFLAAVDVQLRMRAGGPS